MTARLDDPHGAFVQRFSPADGKPALAVKDNIAICGIRPTVGIAGECFPIADRDAFVVARWRKSGGALAGRTRMDEGALGASGENPAFGRTDNPRAPGYSPGGSSCGSAAAVAAGEVPVALGTDTMGSVRIPASYCGIVGFKPSRGVLSTRGILPLAPSLDHVGLLAKDVGGIASAFEVLAAYDPEDASSRHLPSVASAASSLADVVVGVPAAFVEEHVEPAISDAFRGAREALEWNGLRVIEIEDAPFLGEQLRKAAFLVAEAEGATVYSALLADPTSGLSLSFRRLLAFGRDMPAARRDAAFETCRRMAAEARRSLEKCDFIMTPTTTQRAFRQGDHPPAGQADLTVFANAAGLPAISLPLQMTASERPAGLQIVGRDLADRATLATALLIEAILMQRI